MERALAVILVLGCAGYVHGVPVALKGACNVNVNLNLTCDSPLFCQYGTCRAKIGANCTTLNANDECVGNLTCAAANNPCVCSGTLIPNGDNTACVSKVGSNCTNESDCLKNGMCGSDKMCACNVNFTKSNDNSTCLSKVGGSCTDNSDCLTNGACTNKKCDCSTNYARSYDMSWCGLVFDQTCSSSPPACGENSICTSLKCVCNSGFVSNSGRCAKTVNANCTLNAECSLWAECGTTTKTCTCKAPNYVTDDAKQFCKAAPAGGATVYGSLLTLLTLFVTSRML